MTTLQKPPQIAWQMPYYAPVFPYTQAYEYGFRLRDEINEKIYGRIGSTAEDMGILAEALVKAGHGNHLELGCFFGGSAILAALVKRRFGLQGLVYTVDNFSFESNSYPLSRALVMENAERFEVEDRIVVIEGNTSPLPGLASQQRYATAFVDAAHDFQSARSDGLNACRFTEQYVIFHDYDMNHQGVIGACHDICSNNPWWMVHVNHNSAVLWNRTNHAA